MMKQIPNYKHQITTLRQAQCIKSLVPERSRRIRNSQSGFTLIELLVVTFIIATLTGIVTFNFSRQRSQQEVQAAAVDLISRIRELQTDILAGSEVVSGIAPNAYEVVFAQGTGSYRIDYISSSGTTVLETVSFTQNIQVSQLTGGSTLRITSPFGKIFVDGVANRTLQIDLTHSTGSQTRSVIIDGISGRITEQ